MTACGGDQGRDGQASSPPPPPLPEHSPNAWPWVQISDLASLNLSESVSSSIRPRKAVAKIKKDNVCKSTGWHLESIGYMSAII